MKIHFIKTILFLSIIQLLFPIILQAQNVNVRILKVPGWQGLLRSLRQAGYSASIYGSADRPAVGYQVVAIGSDVPSEEAISVLKLISQHVPSIKYIILAGDHPSIATGDNEVTVGGTNGLMDDFPNSRELDRKEISDLIEMGENRKDLFYSYIRNTYLMLANETSTDSKVRIREDGVLVYPNPDGSAQLISPSGRRGFLTKDGEERWPMADYMEQKPVREAGVLNQEWLDEMDNWLTWIAEKQYRDIKLLLEDSVSVNTYKSYENTNCETMYEKIHMRRKYLNILIEKQNN